MKQRFMLKDKIETLISQALERIGIVAPIVIEVTVPSERKFGDFSTNIAFQICKQLDLSPLQAATKVQETIARDPDLQRIEVLPPGFVNFFVSDQTLLDDFFGYEIPKMTYGKGKTVVTDSSHPNIAKPMGIHHLLSTIIGDSINKILSYCGYTVIRDNFIGDVGTQFGKLIYAYKTWGKRKEIDKDPIPELLKLYVRFHDEAEKEPTLEEEGRKEFKKLEAGDKENRKLWEWMVDISHREFLRIYERLGVKFDIMNGESFYEDKMVPIISLGKTSNVFVPGEGGALVCHFEKENLPTCVIQKSDGATMYHTRDLARIAYWEKTYHPALMINVVDSAQELHFRQLFAISDRLELTKARNVHVSFGRMQFADKKMSTRKGNIILLQDVLDEAVQRSKNLLEEKQVDGTEDEKEVLAEIIGIGAVKYAILSQNRNTNIIFDWDKIISLEGNSGPYLQYTYTRAMSILKKNEKKQKQVKTNEITLDPIERELFLHCMQYEKAVLSACTEYRPNIIANYLYQLSGLFNSFYNKLPVLQAEENKKYLRLKIVETSSTILKAGLELLGIQVPDRM